MPNDQIRRLFCARCSLSFGFGRTPRSIDKIAKKTSKKHKFRHVFHCLLASGGRPAHWAKVVFGAILTNENQKNGVSQNSQKMVFGAILNNENQKKHEKTAFARGFKTMKKQDLRTQPICPILPDFARFARFEGHARSGSEPHFPRTSQRWRQLAQGKLPQISIIFLYFSLFSARIVLSFGFRRTPRSHSHQWKPKKSRKNSVCPRI